jgi:diguanylate cyclase (GGDEF)-like protein/PAS domain S-box-containing protein
MNLHQWLVIGGMAAAAIVPMPGLAQGPAGADAPVSSLTVVIDDNYPPYSFRDANGALRGIRKDMWDQWSARTGVPVYLEGLDWGQALARMSEGRADVIDTIFKTPARLPLYDFSEPYASIDVALYFHKDIGGISDVRSVRGFAVGVKDGDACIDWLTSHGGATVRRYPSYESLILAAGGMDVRVLCVDAPPANYFLYREGLASAFRHTAPLYTGQFHWAVRKGNARLLEFVEQGFRRIPESQAAAIENRWLGYPLGDPHFTRYMLYGVLGATLLTLALVLWNWSLRRRVAARTRELVRALDALQASTRHFQDLVSTTPVGVFETDRTGASVFFNDRWLEIAGMTREQALGEGWLQAVRPDFRESVRAQWADAVERGREISMEFCLERADGRQTWVLAQAHPVRDEGGAIAGYIGSTTDITERREAETRIAFLAHHDALTELPNRALARDRAQVAMAIAERSRQKLALIFLDLDDFKTVNDSLGHAAGDALLREVAARLRRCTRDSDTISRQGGDEFLIVMPEMPDTDAVAAAAGKVVEAMVASFSIEGQEVATSVSAGIAVYPDDGKDFDTLLKKADTAMYHAKDSGRGTYRFFSEQLNRDSVEHLRIQAALHRALENHEFELHYQPQVDLASGRVVGAEALLRWNHPELGMVPPARFIPVAESSGTIVPIGEWVIREACRQAAACARAGHADLVVAVNLSAAQFRRGDLHETVRSALEHAGCEPRSLELELTESILIRDTQIVLESVRRIKALGVGLSIDDFGTGYSSLSYLRRFPLDKLKIDQSFVKDMVTDPESAAIVRAIIQLALALNLRTVAEGVETAEAAAQLRRLRCHEAQGYYFSRPVPAGEFIAYLERSEVARVPG